jgi:hypothetical protein
VIAQIVTGVPSTLIGRQKLEPLPQYRSDQIALRSFHMLTGQARPEVEETG